MNNVYSNIFKPIIPKQFDENEIYTIAITILVLGVLYFLLKRESQLSAVEVSSIYLFNLFITTTLESLFAEHPLDFYDTLDYAHAEIFDVVLQTLVYPPPIIIALYFYSKYKPNWLIYTLFWALLLTCLELVSLQFNLFQFKSWSSIYSFIFYVFTMVVNIIFFRRVRRIIRLA
ncbi:hypothetical protein JOC95_001048 [Bacillus tianshenii]|uniref:Uncharacterized protein n=1 Tax=Sutcliffiella tianshenii TaxID=1463404 RepID=A0ABS2NX02_9BACI|nr:hypothetical protein [Bacillus tianshenii]MBM7619199.1 hypothetical protein [Bacillus tianshenii]